GSNTMPMRAVHQMANTNLILTFHAGPLHIEWERIHKGKEQATKGLEDLVDEDSNGAIDPQELKHAFSKKEINFTDEESNSLFQPCDINEDMGIKFSEFIVLLCLVYLLKDDPSALHTVSGEYIK
ncbi:probable calcium-binding protein CML21, partial [Capsicum annuum]|uniref:probable calcium-binding protein CML21 n=1 Tax=Capsicum annuum TaxID=4072 RepID=UPI001FB04BE0